MADTQQVKNTVLGEMLDRINKTNEVRKGYGKSTLPTNVDENTLKAAETWDYANNKQGIAPAVASTPEVATPTNPFNIDQSLYQNYRGAGLTDNQIGRIHGATPETPFTDIFKKTEVEPEPINEAKVKASRNVANLGEGIKVLGDMFAVNRGARIGKRNAGDIVNAQATKEDAERNKYLAKLEGFKAGERQAAEKDWMLAFQNREKRAGEVRADMKEMRAKEDADKKYNREFKFREGQAAESKRQFEINKKLQEKGLAIRAERADNPNTPKKTKRTDAIQANIKGTPYWIKNTTVSDIVSRARKADITQNSDPDYQKFKGMKDDQVFNMVKENYLKDDGKGNMLVAHEEGKFPTDIEEGTKENITEIDPAGIL